MYSNEELAKMLMDRTEEMIKILNLTNESIENIHKMEQYLSALCTVQDEQIRRLETEVAEIKEQINSLLDR